MALFTTANLATFGGWLAAALSPLLVYLAMRRKTDVDESAAILTAWKDLLGKHQEQMAAAVDAHKAQMAATVEAHKAQMESALADYERRMAAATKEIGQLNDKISAHEKRITVLEEENRTLRTENEGLRRQIAQKSQSEVQVLGPNLGAKAPTSQKRFRDPDTDLIDKLGGKA